MGTDRRREIGMSRLINLVVYKVKKGKDEEFKKLLALHWPALNKLGVIPLVIFIVTYPMTNEVEHLVRAWGFAPPRLALAFFLALALSGTWST